MQSARKLFFFLLAGLFLTNLSVLSLDSTAFAEGTRTWEQSKFDELTKGTATGVAIRSAGGLELAPTFKSFMPRLPPISGRLQPTMPATSMSRQARPRACTASRPTARRRSFSSPRNSRCRRCKPAPEARSTRPPLPMARSTSWNTGPKLSRRRTPTAESPPTRKIRIKLRRQRRGDAGHRSLLELIRLFRAGHEIHLGPGAGQGRQSLRRHRRSRRNLSSHAQRRALGLLQER